MFIVLSSVKRSFEIISKICVREEDSSLSLFFSTLVFPSLFFELAVLTGEASFVSSPTPASSSSFPDLLEGSFLLFDVFCDTLDFRAMVRTAITVCITPNILRAIM